MTAKEFKLRFLTVHKCASCHQILEYERAEKALCEKCEQRINQIILHNCETCFANACECTCMPRQLARTGVLCHRKLFFYDPDNAHAVENRLIYNLKDRRLSRLSQYFAEGLARAASEELEVLGTDNAIIAYVPRSKKSYRALGFDQSRELAIHMSRILDIPYLRAFDTRIAAKPQKSLSAAQRLENARKNIYALKEIDVKGKYVLLIDDIVTTGAGMRVCSKLLFERGARGVMCFSIASKNKM